MDDEQTRYTFVGEPMTLGEFWMLMREMWKVMRAKREAPYFQQEWQNALDEDAA